MTKHRPPSRVTHHEPEEPDEFQEKIDWLRHHASPEEAHEFWRFLRDEIAHALVADSSALVYYVRFADRIKIGTTGNLQKRLQGIPHDEVLVTEPGDRAVERMRHQQFADLRITGEWFRREEPLISHIAALAAEAQVAS